LFEDVKEAKKRGNSKAGAVPQLQSVVNRIRSGTYESLGLKRGAIIVPVLLVLEKTPDWIAFPLWLDQECESRSLLHAPKNVRPLTTLDANDFANVISYAKANGSASQLLCKKASCTHRHRSADHYLADRSVVSQPVGGRPKFLVRELEALTAPAMDRLERNLKSTSN
jgi:hypothetical protein